MAWQKCGECWVKLAQVQYILFIIQWKRPASITPTRSIGLINDKKNGETKSEKKQTEFYHINVWFVVIHSGNCVKNCTLTVKTFVFRCPFTKNLNKTMRKLWETIIFLSGSRQNGGMLYLKKFFTYKYQSQRFWEKFSMSVKRYTVFTVLQNVIITKFVRKKLLWDFILFALIIFGTISYK